MRYMMLVYSTEPPGGMKPEEAEQIRAGHRRVMDEAARKGVSDGAPNRWLPPAPRPRSGCKTERRW